MISDAGGGRRRMPAEERRRKRIPAEERRRMPEEPEPEEEEVTKEVTNILNFVTCSTYLTASFRRSITGDSLTYLQKVTKR